MNINHLDLRGGEYHKHAHTPELRGATDAVLHVLSEINISFAPLLRVDADWHPFLRGRLRDIRTHTSHTSAARTHTEALRAVTALTDVSAALR